ncbi:MAG: TetR/AcrR family transcriptional regulator [Deltaproteobacteria bacterium]|nr:TetR/AcrR family transcriptional regulator [Deltaproteobacteria bacterium]
MTPPLERDSYHHGDLRHALVEAAVKLIAERGAEGFSLREAGRLVGVSPTAAYRHFADKSALLGAVASDGFSRLAAAMEKGMARAPGAAGGPERAVARMAALGEAYVDFALRHPSHFRIMFGPWLRETECVPGVGPSGKDPFQLLVETLDEAAAAGVIPAEARAGAEVVAWSTVHGFAALVVDGTLPLSARERAAALRRVLTGVLLALGADASRLPPVEAVKFATRCS